MAKGIIYLAKAGTGKTTFITSGMSKYFNNKNVLYITYTNQNTVNLKEKLFKSSIKFRGFAVQTFFQFLFREFIKPFKLSIQANFNLKDIKGLTFRSKSQMKKFKFIPKSSSAFWQDLHGNLYCDKLAALLMDSRSKDILTNAISRIATFYDYIVIDEFQDIVNPEIKFLQKISRIIKKDANLKLILVGDLYQSCVVCTSLTVKPYDSFESNMLEEEFLQKVLKLRKTYFDIDNDSLKRSYRVPNGICEYIRQNLNIDIESQSKNPDGNVIIIDNEKELLKIVDNKKPKLLVYNVKDKQKIINKFNVDESLFINYGISKGMEYPDVMIFLTKAITDALNNHSLIKLKRSSLNKFYVALTRTKNNVYLVPNNLYK